jgi:hypothetical protein
VNQQDQQAIDELFQHLYQATGQAGPRDGAAEALIQRYVQQAPPGLLYQMAQMLIAQQHTLNQLRSQLAANQQQGGAPAGFAQPQGAGYQAYGQPRYQQGGGYQQSGYQQPGGYQQPAYQQPGRQGGGFLAGAGKLALGIGGGILGAEVLSDVFGGVGRMFDDNHDRDDRESYDDGYREGFTAGDDDRGRDDRESYDDGYREGFAAGDDYRGQGDYQGPDPGGFDDPGTFDNGGFDNGGFDDNGGIF